MSSYSSEFILVMIDLMRDGLLNLIASKNSSACSRSSFYRFLMSDAFSF